MQESNVPAQYMQIALDIATRIASGEFREGGKIFGRSVMSSEYSVSPETIRRALKRLEDMKVVVIRPQSGVEVLSADSARRYIDHFGQHSHTQGLQSQLKDLVTRYADLNRQLVEVSTALISGQDTFSAAASAPFPNYEIRIPEGSKLIGKSIGALRFWQATAATIIAIRRGQHVFLSPGPFAELYARDVIVLVGNSEAIETAREFVKETIEKGGSYDTV